jgi:hypothetical protein
MNLHLNQDELLAELNDEELESASRGQLASQAMTIDLGDVRSTMTIDLGDVRSTMTIDLGDVRS